MRQEGAVWILLLLAALAIAVLVARSYAGRARREAEDAARLKSELTKASQELSEKGFKIEGLSRIIRERKIQFPWLATAFADFHALEAERVARRMETKRHPARRSAEEVRDQARQRREAERGLRVLRYRVEYYEKLFPWILDYVGDDVPDAVLDVSGATPDSAEDAAAHWLAKAEYEKLPTAERYQRALDNWRRRKKSNWEIGRDYERYVGYLYETMGYDVEFTGAIEGFDDMGRDVIATRGSELIIIQCKYWAEHREVREKHIFQLFGSAFEYAFRFGKLGNVDQRALLSNPSQALLAKPVLYTSTRVSAVAKAVASKLGVQIHEMAKISEYPMVKCNVALRDGEKIYHLPFDQQYDRVKIAKASEKYVYTVADAESAGFRRAWRWKPSN